MSTIRNTNLEELLPSIFDYSSTLLAFKNLCDCRKNTKPSACLRVVNTIHTAMHYDKVLT